MPSANKRQLACGDPCLRMHEKPCACRTHEMPTCNQATPTLQHEKPATLQALCIPQTYRKHANLFAQCVGDWTTQSRSKERAECNNAVAANSLSCAKNRMTTPSGLHPAVPRDRGDYGRRGGGGPHPILGACKQDMGARGTRHGSLRHVTWLSEARVWDGTWLCEAL